jgi:hypothetical protein
VITPPVRTLLVGRSLSSSDRIALRHPSPTQLDHRPPRNTTNCNDQTVDQRVDRKPKPELHVVPPTNPHIHTYTHHTLSRRVPTMRVRGFQGSRVPGFKSDDRDRVSPLYTPGYGSGRWVNDPIGGKHPGSASPLSSTLGIITPSGLHW